LTGVIISETIKSEAGDYHMDNQEEDLAKSVYGARFNSEDVKVVAGINEATLQNWLARGQLNLEQQNPGRGKARQYTAYEVARIRFVKRLVDLGFPLVPAFKITAALKKLWEATPGGHEAYGRESNLASWLLIAEAGVWTAHRRSSRFPLDHSPVQADDFVAIWAVEMTGSTSHRTIRDAINFFGDAAVVVVNMGVLLEQTVSHLRSILHEKDG
jgi:hypothetical protein